MKLSEIAETVGQFVDLAEGRGQIIGTAGWSPSYSRIRLEDGRITCRQTAHLLPLLSTTTTRRATVPAKTRPAAKSAPTPAKPARRTKLAVAMDGTDAELAEFLLARPTYSDAQWKSRAGGKSRRKGETRSDFIRRALVSKEAEL